MESSASQDPSAQDSPTPEQNAPSASRPSQSHRSASRATAQDLPLHNKNAPIPDEAQGADLPLTMSASVVLTSLPRDAHQAMADAEAVDTGKGK